VNALKIERPSLYPCTHVLLTTSSTRTSDTRPYVRPLFEDPQALQGTVRWTNFWLSRGPFGALDSQKDDVISQLWTKNSLGRTYPIFFSAEMGVSSEVGGQSNLEISWIWEARLGFPGDRPKAVHTAECQRSSSTLMPSCISYIFSSIFYRTGQPCLQPAPDEP
jgi:hypothetical protein